MNSILKSHTLGNSFEPKNTLLRSKSSYNDSNHKQFSNTNKENKILTNRLQ